MVGALILLFYRDHPGKKLFLLAAYVVCLVGIQGLIRAHARWPGNRVIDFPRHFYPILLYTGFYREVGELNQMFIQGYLDSAFIRIEE